MNFLDNLATLWRAEWFESIGLFDADELRGFGVELETSYLARYSGCAQRLLSCNAYMYKVFMETLHHARIEGWVYTSSFVNIDALLWFTTASKSERPRGLLVRATRVHLVAATAPHGVLKHLL